AVAWADDAALVPDALGIAFAASSGEAVYLPFDDLFGRAGALDLLADAAVPKLIHGAKPLVRALAREGRALRGLAGDTRLLDYVLAAHRKNHELADQALRLMTHTMGLAARGLPDDQAIAARACEAAWLTARLHDLQSPSLQPGQRHVYEAIELPLLPVLAEMEGHGIRLDRERIGDVDRDIAARLDELEARCHALAGHPFNVRSRHELRDVLFTELGLTPTKKVKDGWSTDSDVLEKLVGAHALPGAVLEYRALDKLRGTYLTKLPTYIAADGRIHSTFQQEVAATGRLSSIDPNLQNIPVRSFEGRRIRECFVPDPGHVFLSADYSQVELRVLAHFTRDPVLMAGFAGGEDIHRRTAMEVFGVPEEQVTIELRSAAKAINFGLIYGMSAFRLAGDLAIPQADAQRYMDEYFARMPAVKGWIEETKVHARANGWVETLFGRRRLIPEIHAAAYNDRMGAEREAVNTCIQGTAADIIKLAMLRVRAALGERRLATRMLLQVHDELLFEVPEAEVEAATALVAEEMRAAADLMVPLVVNTAIGRTWNEAHG
ncbi:MAG TPA: DNA polymerase, partial [Myxococcota bacterium]|nr:DNA polymerase [Myxococcota bacterium]